jgi:pyruvate dehydrogenase E1 component alpha subunit
MGSAGAAAAFVSVPKQLPFGHGLAPKGPNGTNGSGVFRSERPNELLAKEPKEKLAGLYELMQRSRRWETAMKDAFVGGKDGLYGAFHCYIGEEAISTGVSGNLNTDDYVVSTHRGHGHLIAKGGDLKKMAAEIFFKPDGYNKGFGGSMHITDSALGILGMNGIVGASWYIAAGAAYGAKIRGTKQVAIAYGGDGASNSPYYFSALRNAYNYGLPMIAVVENNGWQITIPQPSNVPGGSSATYTKGLPIPSVTVDGTDLAAVYAAAKEAIERARNGGGPSVIEAVAGRWYDHAGFAGAKVGVDGAFGLPYRPDSEVRYWQSRDPIALYKAWLIDTKAMTEDELAAIDTKVQKTVDEAMEFARSAPAAKPEDGILNVYAKGSVMPTQFLNGLKPTAWNHMPEGPIWGRDIEGIA